MITLNPPAVEQNEIANLDLFLLNLRYKEGRLVEAEGNQPILLDDPDSAWVVYSGTIDLFAIPCPDEENLGAPEHLFRSKAGQLFLGISPATQGSIRLLMRGTTGTRLIRMAKARLWELAQQFEFSEIISTMCSEWVLGLSAALGRELTPKECLQLEAGQSYQIAASQVVLAARGLIWVQFEAGAAHILGDPALAWATHSAFLP